MSCLVEALLESLCLLFGGNPTDRVGITPDRTILFGVFCIHEKRVRLQGITVPVFSVDYRMSFCNIPVRNGLVVWMICAEFCPQCRLDALVYRVFQCLERAAWTDGSMSHLGTQRPFRSAHIGTDGWKLFLSQLRQRIFW